MPFVFSVLLLALTGCNVYLGEDIRAPSCEVTDSSITPDEETDLGISGHGFMDSIPGSTSSVLFWNDGTQSSLATTIVLDESTLRYQESVEVLPEGNTYLAIDVNCTDSLTVDGTLTLQSDDGQIDAILPVTFTLDEYDVDERLVRFFVDLDEEDLGGDFSLDDHVDERDYDAVSLYLMGTLLDNVLTGELAVNAEGSGEDTVFVERIVIATVDGE